MTLTPGTRLGPYEILAPIGAGAMGQVYRARDPRLGREVAVKILPGEFTADAERLRRFTQEARAAGALQHPNIVTVYDVGSESGTPYVVQELVAGGTLRERLARGPLPVREALRLAAGIASGLAAAHEKGVVHRDLKPDNVVLAADGRPQILDFGLARMNRPEADATIAMESTASGVVLGTVGYMAPEQVRGETADARTDLFALGSILHEMLSGARPFRRDTTVETMHAILRDDPASLPAAVPAAIGRMVARCLEKDPARRFQSARDLAFTLEALTGDGSQSQLESVLGAAVAMPEVARRGAPGGRGAWFLGAALLVAGGAIGWTLARVVAPADPGGTIRVSALSHGSRDGEPAGSSDGRLVAFSAVRSGGQGIWLMDLASRSEVRLTRGLDNLPRFAPDAASVLFTRSAGNDRALYRVPILGGQPRLILNDASDGDWSPDGSRIAFMRATLDTSGSTLHLMLSDANGGNVRELWSRPSSFLTTPRWSPDGRSIALIRSANQNVANAVLVVSVEDGSVREFPAPNGSVLSNACWDGTGTGLVVVEGEGLVAVQRGASGRAFRLDVRSGRYEPLGWLGEYTPIVDLLPDGRLVLSSLSGRQNLREVSIDARSAGEGRWLTQGMGIDRQPVYSRDGRWVIFSSNRGGSLDLWEVSVETGEQRRITDDRADDWDPVPSWDGESIYWSSNRTGPFEIWTARRDGSAPRQVSRDSVDAENPSTTPDGRRVIYSSSHPAKTGLWRVGLDGSGAEHLLARPTYLPEISPDGRHLAAVVGIGTLVSRLEIMDLATGRLLPHPVPIPLVGSYNPSGRSRWMPDGGALVYVESTGDGRDHLLRRPLRGWETGAGVPDTLLPASHESIESFGISPDGRRLAISVVDWLSALSIAEGVRGIVPPRRAGGAAR